MSPEAAFLQDIREHPDDDAPRLIFADWLDERGDAVSTARAELIRLQVELARLPITDPRRAGLRARGRALLESHEPAWARELHGLAVAGEYRRGFVEKVTMSATTFLSVGEQLFRLAPVREVHLRGARSVMKKIAACPVLARLSGLDLSGAFLTDDDVGELARSPHLGGLVRLDLHNNEIVGLGLAALARWPHLGRLTTLDLSLNRLIPDAVVTFLAMVNGAPLTTLHLNGNPLGDAGLRVLASSRYLSRLTALHLSGVGCGEAGARWLAHSRHLRSLRTLDLSFNDLGDEGIMALASSEVLRTIETLDLRYTGVGERGARALATSPHLAAETILNLAGNRLDAQQLRDLRSKFRGIEGG